MSNTFTLILALATLITAIMWCIKRFNWALFYIKKNAVSTIESNKSINVSQLISSLIENGASIFPFFLLIFIVRSFVCEPFQISSGSMMPTLLIGDFILVKKYTYGIKNPITQTTLIKTGYPKRGDIVVFKYPLNPKLDYIKRVIGLPGDRVIYDPINKRVIVNPSCDINRTCDKTLSITYHDMKPSDFVQTFGRNSIGENNNGFHYIPLNGHIPKNGIRLSRNQETIGKVNHSILSIPGVQDQTILYYQQPNTPLAEWVVSDGQYFMMGDNRDNSADSRYWGFVPEKNLVGKATMIWMSFKKQESEWPTGIRLSRIGVIY